MLEDTSEVHPHWAAAGIHVNSAACLLRMRTHSECLPGVNWATRERQKMEEEESKKAEDSRLTQNIATHEKCSG